MILNLLSWGMSVGRNRLLKSAFLPKILAPPFCMLASYVVFVYAVTIALAGIAFGGKLN